MKAFGRIFLLLFRSVALGFGAWLAFMHFAIGFEWYWIKGPQGDEVAPFLNEHPFAPLVLLISAVMCWLLIDRDTDCENSCDVSCDAG